MTKTKSNAISDTGAAFWFAVLSPLIGILVGLLALFLIYH
jgi:hypothetical protein